MDDRRVCQINPDTGQNAAPAPFSSFADRRNIVVLGDPGAGKSHLFRQAAHAAGGVLYTARNFLNAVDGGIPKGATLFIDALDEKRSGRGDDDTIDALVQRIQRVRPQYLRIACRAADWLGESDLAAFKPYFDANGGVTVVGLEPLHPSEQAEILQDLAVGDVDAFLTQARARGLDGMLVNPQTLIMLADVVRNGDWPSTRTELF
jgi:predicted NACHT family NTPase